MKKIVDGNGACSLMAYLFSEIACIYPITPSSPMASTVDSLNSENKYNLFHDKVKVVEMQSEAGAAGAFHGALLSGSLAVTFTASQGLLLMIPNMYKIAGEGLPGVIHVASRTIATHALSIFGDHSDIYATRQTGFCMLSSTNVQDAYYLAAVAHLSSIKGSLPFLHFFDGFRTSHELNVIETMEEEQLLKLIDTKKLEEFKKKSLNVGSKVQYGMAENEDIYFQSIEARNSSYEEISDIVASFMHQINNLTNTSYEPFNYYGSKNATNIIIAMGSVCDTIKLVIEEEAKKGRKLGLIEVHLYRPFSKKYLEKVLPKTVQKVAVLDRTKEAGSSGEPLYLDVLSTLKDHNLTIVGGRYGISSKNTTPKEILAVFDMLDDQPKNNFTIGIVDDKTKLSLPVKEEYNLNLSTLELKIYGFGSDGMVSASKDLLKIIGEEKKYVQGYFEYDSKKSGGVTISHLRIGNELIKAPYYGTNSDITVVTKDEYFQKFPLLDGVKENSILLINTPDEQKCLEKISLHDYEIICKKNLKILTINAEELAAKNHLNGKISKIMEIILLSLLGVENPLDKLKQRIAVQFKTKGQEIIEKNNQAIYEALSKVRQIFLQEIPTKKEDEPSSIFEKINRRMGNQITVKEIEELKNGAFPYAMSKLEKRKISSKVVKWNKENCIQCGMCSFVCPHAVIRPFLIKEEKGLPAIGANGYQYFISISEADCTACGLCVNICPGKKEKKALYFGTYEEEKQTEANYYFNSYQNPKIVPKFTVKGSQLEKPRFEFSGACAGCGETSYIKLLTQLYQDELIFANATGCSSIYGGSAPSTPYSLPWANSLFEDNAEFAYGMHLSYELKRTRIKKIIENSIDAVTKETKELYQELLDHFDDFEKTMDLKKKLALCEIPNDLRELLEYVPKRTVWAIGGDGWAYDIGFGGIDHVLSSNENIKILVLDTEVYSNTGGQMSKSSHFGQVAEFADLGKRSAKKDLFAIAMNYPNCYVASISLGANMMHTIKALKEAEEHNGPSIVIAYAPCVEHGIKGGLSCTNQEQKKAVEVGYTLLMRYLPENDLLIIDSKEPDFNRYHELLENEGRYQSLKIKNEALAQELLEKNKENAMKRYAYYKKREHKNTL